MRGGRKATDISADKSRWPGYRKGARSIDTVRRIDWQKLLRQAARKGLSLRAVPYPTKALIFGQGDPSAELYVVCEGLVKLVHVLQDGRSLTLGLLGPGDLFGKSALTGMARQAYAQTLVSTRLLRIKPQELVEICAGSADLISALLTVLAQDTLELQARLLAATRGCLEDELAVLLWFLQEHFGKVTSQGIQLETKFSVQTLAEMLGHSRQRVDEACIALRAEGLVEAHYGQVLIKDLRALQAHARPFLMGAGE